MNLFLDLDFADRSLFSFILRVSVFKEEDEEEEHGLVVEDLAKGSVVARVESFFSPVGFSSEGVSGGRKKAVNGLTLFADHCSLDVGFVNVYG